MKFSTIAINGGLTINQPVIGASGCLGWGEVLSDLISATALGAFVTPTITVDARIGTVGSRTAETVAGLLYNTGMPNPGISNFVCNVLPFLAQCTSNIVVSVAGSTAQEWGSLGSALDQVLEATALEANLTGLMPAESSTDSASLITFAAKAVGSLRKTFSRSLLIKLPSDHFHTAALCRVVENEGADAIVTGNSLRSAAIRWSGSEPSIRFGEQGGLYSGPAVKPVSLLQAQIAAASTRLPIIAGGGIMTPQDALDYYVAGADVVSLGTLCLVSPARVNTFADDVAELLLTIKGDGLSALCKVGRPPMSG